MMEKKIAMVGHGSVGLLAAQRLQDKGIGVVLVDPPMHHVERVIYHEPHLITASPNVIYCNGVAYEPIPKIAGRKMFSDSYGSGYKRELQKGTNIPVEFNLIQLKKSRLSKWERDEVVRIFHKNYRKVK